jgi:hypothetical protein
MGMITKLQAVNNMLLAAGESLVADLNNESGIDTEIALHILDMVSTDYQLRGLANNKVIKKINPDTNGKIFLPTQDNDEDGIISVELLTTQFSTINQQKIFARFLEGSPPKMWNITDDSDVFPNNNIDYYFEVVFKLAWGNLETTVQRAILATAARQYQVVTQGDEASDAFLAYQEQIFSAKQRAADINDKKRNIFENGDIGTRSAAKRIPFSYDPNRFRYWRTV